MDDVEVIRYRYAPAALETLVNDGGIVTNLKLHRWKLLLVPGFVLMQVWWVWRLCRSERVEVIHAHWLVPQGWIAALQRLLPGRKVPFVVTSHGADLFALKGRALNRIKRFVLDRASRATVVSGAMRDTIRDIGGDAGKIVVQPMGVDMQDRFVPWPMTPRSRHELLFVGRLVEKKGLRHLLDALPLVLHEFPQAMLTVAGFGPDEEALKTHVRQLGLCDCVRFIGPVSQDELPRLYQHAALFIAPFVRARSGDEEGLGLVLVEAAACDCPVLAGRVPALKQVLGEGFADMTVDATRPELLAAGVCAVLRDPAWAQARATELRRVLENQFDWAVVAGVYGHVLMSASIEGTNTDA